MGQGLASANQKVLLILGTKVEISHKLWKRDILGLCKMWPIWGTVGFSQETRERAGLSG